MAISSLDSFLAHFRSISGNFTWFLEGERLSAYKWGKYYDPLSALVQVMKGDYLERHEISSARAKLQLTDADFTFIMQALYSPDFADVRVGRFRKALIEASGLHKKEGAAPMYT